jgi:hypothetical protein
VTCYFCGSYFYSYLYAKRKGSDAKPQRADQLDEPACRWLGLASAGKKEKVVSISAAESIQSDTPAAGKAGTRYQRQAAAVALAAALEPFVDLCLKLGITSPEMERVLRAAFVRRAEELLSTSTRGKRPASDTRVGLMIGVHRNFVRQIRTTKPRVQLEKVQHRHRGSALVQAWATDWQFLTATGLPRDLPIRAPPGEPSFEMLVRRHMPGVSTGTAIAELRRSAVVRMLPDEQIRLRSRTARPPGVTSASIAVVSDRMRELSSTLLHNLTTADDQRFCENLNEVRIDVQRLAVVRQMIAKRARTFLDALAAELANEALTPESKGQAVEIGLVICGYEKN